MNEQGKSEKASDFDKLDLRQEEIFINLYDYFAPRLLRHAQFRLGGQEEARDAVAQVFYKTWEHLCQNPKSRKPIKSIRAFLYQTINNQIIDIYRKKSRTEVSLASFEPLESLLTEASDADSVHNHFDVQKVLQVVGALRTDYQKILLWRYLDELSISEMSQVMGKSRGAVSIMLYRALRNLKKILKERGF